MRADGVERLSPVEELAGGVVREEVGAATDVVVAETLLGFSIRRIGPERCRT